jgi:hypothetical protein
MHAPPNPRTAGMKHRFIQERPHSKRQHTQPVVAKTTCDAQCSGKRARPVAGAYKEKESLQLPRVCFTKVAYRPVGTSAPVLDVVSKTVAKAVPKPLMRAGAVAPAIAAMVRRPAAGAARGDVSYAYSRKMVDWSKFEWYKGETRENGKSRVILLPVMCYSKQGIEIMFSQGLPGLMKEASLAQKEWSAFIIQTNAPTRAPGFRLGATLVKEKTCSTYYVPNVSPAPPAEPPKTGFPEAIERLRVAGPVLIKALFDNYERFLEIHKEEASTENFAAFCANVPADCALTADMYLDLFFFVSSLVSLGRSAYHDDEAAGRVPVLLDHSGAPHTAAANFKPLRGYYTDTSATASVAV